jgi:hypothetical protein
MPEALRFTLIEVLMGLPLCDWDFELRAHFQKEAQDEIAAQKKLFEGRRLGTRLSLDLASYSGEYFDPGYGPLKVTFEFGRVVLHWSRRKETREHFHYDTFRAPAALVGFQLGEDGAVRSVRYLGIEFLLTEPKRLRGCRVS